MANKLINQMGLPRSIANIFAARNINTAKEALSLTEFELMELLDVGLSEVASAVAHISEVASPPYQTVSIQLILFNWLILEVMFLWRLQVLSLMEQRLQNEHLSGHLSTCLKGLDEALFGGIPFGVLTELVGPAGIGKTQMAGRILVLRPASLSEFTESLHKIKVSLLEQEIKLVIIDSMAALITGSIAEFARIPIVVTNQVRSRNRNEVSHYSFQGLSSSEIQECSSGYDSHLVAALGVHWAHSVTIRLVLEAKSGQRFIKLAKSPMSPPLAFPFSITSSGISLLSDNGKELSGAEINEIHCQGHSDIISYQLGKQQ
ncbi:DNA repair protein RAD51-like 2 [Cucurbita argyrosperma subsp. argyrosperma]|nr:DNA repair protein RAD51-like 2 [Cucurbita argyrosperma subsp. argyrosperma]